jgi:hypothetical protein
MELNRFFICQKHNKEVGDNEPWNSAARVQLKKKTGGQRRKTRVKAYGIMEELDGVLHTEKVAFRGTSLSKLESSITPLPSITPIIFPKHGTRHIK